METDQRYLVHDSLDDDAPYVVCAYHLEDLRRVDYDSTLSSEEYKGNDDCLTCEYEWQNQDDQE